MKEINGIRRCSKLPLEDSFVFTLYRHFTGTLRPIFCSSSASKHWWNSSCAPDLMQLYSVNLFSHWFDRVKTVFNEDFRASYNSTPSPSAPTLLSLFATTGDT